MVNQARLAEEGRPPCKQLRAREEPASRGRGGSTAAHKLLDEPGWLLGGSGRITADTQRPHPTTIPHTSLTHGTCTHLRRHKHPGPSLPASPPGLALGLSATASLPPPQ